MRAHVFVENGTSDARTLGDLFDERKENGFGHLSILAVTIAGKVVPREALERSVIDKTGTDKYLRVCPGDIAYNTMRMWQGSCGVVAEEGIISPAYTVLVPRKEAVEPVFWNYAFHTPELLDWFPRFSTGVAADRWRLYYGSFAKIPARVPPLPLQRELVEAFTSVELAASRAEGSINCTWDLLQATVEAFYGDKKDAIS
jgi:type I restriction enzyme, S subunit